MNIIDIVLIVLIAVIVILSAKKGFVASCLDTLALAISGFASYKLCAPVSQWAYDLFIGDLVKTEFRQALDDMSSTLPVRDKIAGMLEALPETAIKLVESMGVSIDNLSGTVANAFTYNDEQLIEAVANSVGQKIMMSITQVVVFIALFILITILVRLIANFFSNNLEKVPVVGQLDTLLGGVLGIIKAVVVLIALNVILYIVASTSEPGSSLEAIETSKIYLFLMENNPVMDIIRGM